VLIGRGKTVDLVAVRNGERTALEIEIGRSDVAANVRKCLETGADRAVVAVHSPRLQDRLAKRLPSHPSVDLLTGEEALSRSAQAPPAEPIRASDRSGSF